MGRTSQTIGVALAAAILMAAACRHGTVLMDRGDNDKTARGTIGGILQAPGGGDALAGRRVEAVDEQTSARYAATTNVTGGFSIMVPPGKYRLNVELREGEVVFKDPGTIHIGVSDLDANIEVEVGASTAAAARIRR